MKLGCWGWNLGGHQAVGGGDTPVAGKYTWPCSDLPLDSELRNYSWQAQGPTWDRGIEAWLAECRASDFVLTKESFFLLLLFLERHTQQYIQLSAQELCIGC